MWARAAGILIGPLDSTVYVSWLVLCCSVAKDGMHPKAIHLSIGLQNIAIRILSVFARWKPLIHWTLLNKVFKGLDVSECVKTETAIVLNV